ncbi:MAG: DUF4159 domain-containing protein [Tepidisphaeraceae bacterium]|jgi:hypothetical protein
MHQDDPDSGESKLMFIAAAAAAGLLVIVAMAVVRHRAALVAGIQPQQAQTDPMAVRIVELKGQAEQLAIEGRTSEAHGKYREIERLVAGTHVADTALWDVVERAKQDQMRVYDILLAQQENQVLASRKAMIEARLPQPAAIPAPEAPVAGVEPAPLAPMTRPAIEVAIAPQTRPVALLPTTRPVAAGPATRPVSGLAALPAPQPLPVPAVDTLDAAVGQTMSHYVQFLLSNMKGDEVQLVNPATKSYAEGANALVVFALLKAGQATNDPRLNPNHPLMRGMIERMKDHLMLLDSVHPDAPVTYARAYRLAALTVYNRLEDRKVITADVAWLLAAQVDGAFTYNDKLTKADLDRLGKDRLFMGAPLAAPGQSYYIGDPSEAPRVLLHNGERLVPGLQGSNGQVPLNAYRNGNQFPDLKETQMDTRATTLSWDNSNTQVAVMALASAAEAGFDVPLTFWDAVEKHFLVQQLGTGQWGYDDGRKTASFAMSTAGIASLLHTHERLDAPALGGSTGRPPYVAGLAAGLAWLEIEDNAVRPTAGVTRYRGYNLFNLARVGQMSGSKYFGLNDWYAVLAAKVVGEQLPSGAWSQRSSGNDAIIEAAYTLLFLSTGRPPILFNKLRYDGAWCNRARDTAHLTTFAAGQLERQLNWQIVPITRNWTDWFDSPVLYISGHLSPRISDAELAKLRAFAEAGGLIFSHADGNSTAFTSAVMTLGRKCFPGQAWARVPQNHPIYTLQYPLKLKPEMQMIGNGTRILWLHTPYDIAATWQLRDATHRENFELGVNIFVYAAGKPDLRNRLASPILSEPVGKPTYTVDIARIRYAGSWDPEPYSFTRFCVFFLRETGWKLNAPPVDLSDLTAEGRPLAHLTGTAAVAFDEKAVKRVRDYVDAGGVLFVDACGGSSAFVDSATAMLARAFPDTKLQPLIPAHPLLHSTTPGMFDLGAPILRPYAKQALGPNIPPMLSLKSGKGTVIVCPLDISTALLGTSTYPILGYSPEYAQSLLKNAVLWAAYGRPGAMSAP